MTLKKHFAQILPLAIIVTGLLAYNFMDAQWKGPISSPALNNVPAPINVGTSTFSLQTGKGDLIFNRFVAQDAVWSPMYCNVLGQNCILQENLNYLGGGAFSVTDTKQVPPGGSVSTSCPQNYVQPAISTMTGGGCRIDGIYKELTVNGGDIFSYHTNETGSSLTVTPAKWVCENKNLATTTITSYAVCLNLFTAPPYFPGS